ncbi:MAG: hypothetical protein ACI85O_002774 [Saprospiraceae bacterium]|jgi:hypothetical protein
MKFINSFILLLLFCSISCESTRNDCTYPVDTPIAPTGYTISKIGNFANAEEDIEHFQMVDSTTGYALTLVYYYSGDNENIFQLFKTSSGGSDWTSKPVPFDVVVVSMLFTDENNGYIAHLGDENSAYILKTTDGGTTWENLEFPEFSAPFRELKQDADGNLYALFNVYENNPGVVKSTDNGLSWSEIFTTSGSPYVTQLTIVNDRIYFKESGKLRILDLEGTIVKTVSVEGTEQINVVDENNIIVASYDDTYKTTDGGENWVKIFDEEAKVIDFSTENGLLMLLNKGICDYYYLKKTAFTIGTVDDFPLTESEIMRDFEVGVLMNTQKIGEGHYLLQRNNDIFE